MEGAFFQQQGVDKRDIDLMAQYIAGASLQSQRAEYA
jgi:hypothetical protein